MQQTLVLFLLWGVWSVAGCETARDCALNGECVGGKCQCDVGWTTSPEGGTPCSALDLEPAKSEGYHNGTWSTWGGHPVLWDAADGGDGKWHMFVCMFAMECNVDHWINNSFVAHIVGDSPVGPWGDPEVALPVFSCNPQAVRHPDGTWLIYFIGGRHTPSSEWVNCSASPRTWPTPCHATPSDPDRCGKVVGDGKGILIASSPSPFGPWEIHPFHLSLPGGKTVFDCGTTNPAPFILPNGTVFLAVNGGGCHGGLETVGVTRADHWAGPYHLTSPNPIGSTVGCPTGQFGEDPFLWRGERGWHIIAHALCDWHPPSSDIFSLHAFSEDAISWTVSRNASGLPSAVYSKSVSWANGSTTYISRMERPQLILDSSSRPVYLATAVCPGGRSVGTCYGNPSWTLIRPVRHP